MAKRNTKKKSSAASFFIILIALFYIIYRNGNVPGTTPDNNKKEQPTGKKAKAKKEARYLKTFTGKVTAIKDGDTFEVLYDGQPERVRLAEIDCPEKAQAFGKNAKQYASDLCFGKTVTVTSGGKRDRYGRVVGTIVTQEGLNVNEELVKAGLAWHYKDYSDSDKLAQLEQEAREAKVGLWSARRPVAPWQWRRNKRNRSRKN